MGAAVLLAACSSSQVASTTTTENVQRPSLRLPDRDPERSQPAGSTVKVDRVDCPDHDRSSGGVVAICANANGVPGTCDAYATIRTASPWM